MRRPSASASLLSFAREACGVNDFPLHVGRGRSQRRRGAGRSARLIEKDRKLAIALRDRLDDLCWPRLRLGFRLHLIGDAELLVDASGLVPVALAGIEATACA